MNDDIPTLRLTRCEVCGGDVSAAAPACPHCGHPRAARPARPGWLPGDTVTTQATGKEAKALIAIGGAVFVVGLTVPHGWPRQMLLGTGGFFLVLGSLIKWWHYE